MTKSLSTGPRPQIHLLAALLLGLSACHSYSPADSDGGTNQNTNGHPDAALTDATLTDAAPRDATPPDAAVAEDPHLMQGLQVWAVEVYQTLQIPLMENGTALDAYELNAPVVAERDAMIRIYVTPSGSWSARSVTAELHVGPSGVAPFDPTDPGAGNAFTDQATQTVSGASSESDIGSTFNLVVPASYVQLGSRWAVRLVDPSASTPAVPAGTADTARFPTDGLTTSPLHTESDDGGLSLVLVPLRYDYDGSGRLPDTSSTQLDLIEELLLAIYPTAHVQITVHAVVPWDDSPTFTGNVDFGDINDYLSDLRVSENAPQQDYWYGLIKPDDTFSAYCGGSCVTGQSYVVTAPENADFRVGSGVGFSGESSAWTLAHELGHEHGRSHAPCGVSSYDSSYPYNGGSIGVYGLDTRPSPMLLYSPFTYSDLMGYCDDRWISDYTYQALWDRMIAVNALISPPPPRYYRFLRIAPDGAVTWGRPAALRTAQLAGQGRWIHFRDAGGTVVDTTWAPYLRLSHGGARLLIPEPWPATATTVEADAGNILAVRPSDSS